MKKAAPTEVKAARVSQENYSAPRRLMHLAHGVVLTVPVWIIALWILGVHS